MPAPLAPDVREAILADIRAGKARNQIARDHGVGAGTVSRYARDLSDHPFDRSKTKVATAAVVADVAARRAAVSAEFVEIAALCNRRVREMLEDAESELKPYKVRDLAIATGIYFDKHAQQCTLDNTGDQGSAVVDQWLVAVTGHGKLPDLGSR